MEKKHLFGVQTQANGRTFFFDVREAENKHHYLVITESKKVDEQYERKSFILFEEDLERFYQGLIKATLHFQATDREAMIEEARRKHANAFKPWTDALDEDLKKRFGAGASIDELSDHFERAATAIEARLEKLGLG